MRIHPGLVMRWITQFIQLYVAHDATATGGRRGCFRHQDGWRYHGPSERNGLPGLFFYRSTLDLNRIGILQIQLGFHTCIEAVIERTQLTMLGMWALEMRHNHSPTYAVGLKISKISTPAPCNKLVHDFK